MAKRDNWVDGPHRGEITLAMREAREAFDRAYFKSPSNADLAKHCRQAIAALEDAERFAQDQAVRRVRAR